jgi:DNA-binding transcriptional MerR regulator
MRNLDEYRDWQGSIDELVEMANVALQRLGRGRNADLNIRLVRDYAQRGILSPAERRGKEAVYRFQHLNEIIAARVLLNDGWPLAKIAEQFQTDRNIVVLPISPDDEMTSGFVKEMAAEPSPTSAEDLWKSLRMGAIAPDASSPRASAPPIRTTHEFASRSMETSNRKSSLHRSLRELGAHWDHPPATLVTRIQLTEWCELLLDSDRLRRLSLEDAEAIGRAITAALSDPVLRKGKF